jgi:hypothetical protein
MKMSMDINVSVTLDLEKELTKALKTLGKSDVLVGVPESTSGRWKGPSNAVLAAVHNNGSPINNIPARPTLEPGIYDAREAETKYMQQAATLALEGNREGMYRALEATGTVAVAAVKKRIRSNTPPPLKEKTLKARRRRGVTRTNTLVDTGNYLNAHTFVVREG